MKNVILATVFTMLSTTAAAEPVYEHEALAHVVKVMECVQDGKKIVHGKVNTGQFYGSWVQIRDIKQVSNTRFQFLVSPHAEAKEYYWMSARLFSTIKCEKGE